MEFSASKPKSIHFMRVLDSWGIDLDVVKKLEGECKEVKIQDPETNLIYTTPFKTFTTEGFVQNYGNEQMFLPLKYWDIKRGDSVLQERVWSREELQPTLL